MLSMIYGEEGAMGLLMGSETRRIRLPSLRSVHETTRWQEGGGGVERGLRILVGQRVGGDGERLAEWHWPNGESPRCILQLGVAIRELEKKLRLIYDGRYINPRLIYEPFKYEGLKDVPDYAEKGGWATVSDYKAGYHHISCPALSRI